MVDTGAWKLVDESRVTCIEEMQVLLHLLVLLKYS